MWKRCIVSLLVVVICVPLLSVPARAETLDVDKVAPAELLPVGYVVMEYPNYFSGSRQRTVVFYDSMKSGYIYIGFNGALEFTTATTGRFQMKFSDPGSLIVRYYECTARDIFQFNPEHKMKIEFPAQKLMDIKFSSFSVSANTGGTPGYRIYINPENYDTGSYSNIYSSSTGNSVYYMENEHYYIDFPSTSGQSQTITIPKHDAEALLNAISGTITVEEFSSRNIDYYLVQKQGSGVKSSIDAEFTYYVDGASGVFRFSDKFVNGYPVALSVEDWSVPMVTFSSGSYYFKSSTERNLQILNYEKLLGTSRNRPTVSIINRFLSHFGYATIFYSELNDNLSNEISGLGDQMDQWSSQAGQFQQQAGQATNDIKSSLQSFNSLFTGVWNVLPGWFYTLLAIALVIVVGRKILGR